MRKAGLVTIASSVLFTLLSTEVASAQYKCSQIYSSNVASIQAVVAEQASFEKPKKSPLAPKPLPIRVVENIYRWYIKKDDRVFTEKKLDFLNDFDYLQDKRTADKVGIVRSVFSKKYDTRIYYTATGVPDAAGRIPVVDPKSRALFVYFHGSGTNKASGVNFAYKANKLATLGYSTLAIDLPYHSDGSRSTKMLEPDNFYPMLKNLLAEYRQPGMPVYLAGHSFGPDVAAEYIKRYPFDVDGILMISPGSFNKVLEDWFMNNTAHMTALWGDIVSNDSGAAWAGVISSKHSWRNAPTQQSPDPTVVNPRLKVNIISGEFEEYVPGKLDARGLPTKEKRDYDICRALMALFSGGRCIIEPGVGHYIFEHKDVKGQDVILRELLAIDGKDIANEKQMREEVMNSITEVQDFARRYAREEFFKQYINMNFQGRQTVKEIVMNNDLTQVRKIMSDYNRYVVPQRDRAMAANMKNTESWNPEFYMANKAEIDALDLKKPRPSDSLLNKYFKMLEELPEGVRAMRGLVSSEEVFFVPVKQGPPPHILERMKREQEEKMKLEQEQQQKAS